MPSAKTCERKERISGVSASSVPNKVLSCSNTEFGIKTGIVGHNLVIDWPQWRNQKLRLHPIGWGQALGRIISAPLETANSISKRTASGICASAIFVRSTRRAYY
jgi:hypothetical protein